MAAAFVIHPLVWILFRV